MVKIEGESKDQQQHMVRIQQKYSHLLNQEASLRESFYRRLEAINEQQNECCQAHLNLLEKTRVGDAEYCPIVVWGDEETRRLETELFETPPTPPPAPPTRRAAHAIFTLQHDSDLDSDDDA